MMRLPLAWEPAARSSACGENASSKNASPVWKSAPVRGGLADFPPELVVQVKALVVLFISIAIIDFTSEVVNVTLSA